MSTAPRPSSGSPPVPHEGDIPALSDDEISDDENDAFVKPSGGSVISDCARAKVREMYHRMSNRVLAAKAEALREEETTEDDGASGLIGNCMSAFEVDTNLNNVIPFVGYLMKSMPTSTERLANENPEIILREYTEDFSQLGWLTFCYCKW